MGRRWRLVVLRCKTETSTPRPTRDDDEKPERRLQKYLLITNKNVLCWNSRTLNFYRLERLIHFLNISILYTYISNFFFFIDISSIKNSNNTFLTQKCQPKTSLRIPQCVYFCFNDFDLFCISYFLGLNEFPICDGRIIELWKPVLSIKYTLPIFSGKRLSFQRRPGFRCHIYHIR